MVKNTRSVYQSYYTKSSPIVSYMTRKLSIADDMRVFEPCAGDGVFIDSILQHAPNAKVDVFELNPLAESLLRTKYKFNNNINITLGDTLLDPELDFFANMGGVYDRIIGNPPYGAWQEFDKRNLLKEKFRGLYVKETYSLFLYRCLQLLRENGRLVFIIPETFLNLHLHKSLREYLLTNFQIEEILIIPSDFFPGVNFGYAKLSIITVKKKSIIEECLENEIKITTNLKDVSALDELGSQNANTQCLKQLDIYLNIDYAFFISDKPKLSAFINNAKFRISDAANCVTGFYSGNDKKYLQVLSKEIKNSKHYSPVNTNSIVNNFESTSSILDGIDSKECFVPIVKGGSYKYFKPDLWFMNWSKEAVQHYKSDKKARFQNSHYYFNSGISIPMVTSKQISAALMENKLFDQSIVGVFPKNPDLLYYLLAFFNSPTCNKLIRTINPTANNSANYIKKIPFIYPSDDDLKFINSLTEQIINQCRQNMTYDHDLYDFMLEDQINEKIKQIYGF